VRSGLCVANTGTYSNPRATVRIARAAEESGWDGIFLWDHLAFVWGPPAGDPWVVLTAVAAATERVQIGTAVTPVARRRPHVLAQTVATLDVFSGGRVVFGAGLGGIVSEFERFGEPGDAKVRAEMLDEGLEVLRGLWSGMEVHHRGRHYTVDGVTLAPPPAQQRVPIWVGGNARPSLRRAARWDGWIADSFGPAGLKLAPEDVARSLHVIREAREGDEPFTVAALGESDKGDPAAYAQAGVEWWLENVNDRRGSPEQMLELVRAGPPSGATPPE
jgi:alkanesulfonate monooxygenase SsuD/methylene tetrahydromethanopterin reductase-like flavin-dependent oxidoreductase (luciferase family)